MRVATHVKHQVTLPIDAPSLFEWFGKEGVFLRLSPPWQRITLLSRDPGLEAGNRTAFAIQFGPFTIQWVSEQVDNEYNESFTDMQIKGPFQYWLHTHRFRFLDESSCIMEDIVRYLPPGGPIIHFFFRRKIKRSVKAIFRYRARILFNDFTCITRYSLPKKRVLIAGGSGFIGTELTAFLRACGHEVFLLTRAPKNSYEIGWDIDKESLDKDALEGFDAIINLAGENIGAKRWTALKKETIRTSRIDATKLLVKTINTLDKKPAVFICASAIGIFGTKVRSPQNENGEHGGSFLSEVCEEWEKEAQKADCRTVNTRFGLVLSPKGGVLKQLLTPFKYGVGGKIGKGNQLVSWITMDDLLYQMYHVLATESIHGPVNFVAEETVTNKTFTEMLGKIVRRPTFFSLPRFLITLLFGQMGEETLLASTAAIPEKLARSGSTFAYPTLKKALEHLLPK